MITARGPGDILVIDRTVVPVHELAAETLYRDNVSDLLNRYPVSRTEYFHAIDVFVDNFGPNQGDFIELECDSRDGDVSIDTVGISDWCYLHFVAIGHDIEPEFDDLTKLFIIGIESAMMDCLLDIKTGDDSYEDSDIHNYLIHAFRAAYGKVGDEIDDLIISLEKNSQELRQQDDDLDEQ